MFTDGHKQQRAESGQKCLQCLKSYGCLLNDEELEVVTGDETWITAQTSNQRKHLHIGTIRCHQKQKTLLVVVAQLLNSIFQTRPYRKASMQNIDSV